MLAYVSRDRDLLPHVLKRRRTAGAATACAALAVAGAVAASVLPVAFAQEKPHPRLVESVAPRCEGCHQERAAGKRVVHGAVSDCTSCHRATTTASGTTMAMRETGPALCLGCHDAFKAAAAGELKASHPPVGDSCTTCHDPHLSDVDKLLVAAVPELCTTCHEASGLQAAHGGQVTERTDCRACHAPHGAATPHMFVGTHLHPPFADKTCEACHRPPLGGRTRLRARGERLCTACHGDMAAVRGAPTASVHAPINAGRAGAGCISCHGPHLSANAKLLLKPSPQLCATCHADIHRRASAEGGHPPAADDCLTCHRPHGSDKPHLLRAVAPALCLDCHEAAALTRKHLGADVKELVCTQCHTPHGDGNPKLLARNVHPPVLEDCGTCHMGSARELVENGESALCLNCHDDIGQRAQKAKAPHAALEMARCVDCHNPHASPQQRLVKAPGGGPCLTCHEEKGAGPGESQHGVVNLLGCRACHEPHGGDNPKLLRRTGNDLCLGCHDARRQQAQSGGETVRLLDRFEVPAAAARALATLRLSVDADRGHPVPGHRVSGAPTEQELKRVATTFKGQLGCLTCHDPHKSKSPRLLRFEVASTGEACLKCHPK